MHITRSTTVAMHITQTCRAVAVCLTLDGAQWTTLRSHITHRAVYWVGSQPGMEPRTVPVAACCCYFETEVTEFHDIPYTRGYLRSSLFSVLTQCMLIVSYRRSGTAYRSGCPRRHLDRLSLPFSGYQG